MAGKKLTPEELAAKIDWIKGALEKNPTLSRCHFTRYCGYAPSMLDALVEEGEIVFQPSRPRNLNPKAQR